MIVQPNSTTPPSGVVFHDANFRHLVWDLVWFGLALTATSRFLSVYAIRVGADSLQLGWITSLPMLVLLISSSFGAMWVKRFKNVRNAVIIPGFIQRLVFLLPVFTVLFPIQWQPLWLIFSATAPAMATGFSAVGFVCMMRQAIPDTRLPQLLARRSLALNIALSVGAVAFGAWLEAAPFPFNYQVMFVVAFVFSLLSFRNCLSIRVESVSKPVVQPNDETAKPAATENPWRSPNFKNVAIVAAVIHVAYLSVNPIIPLHLVDTLGATEGFMAMFGLVELVAGALVSLFIPRIVRLVGARTMIAGAMLATAVSTFIIALAPSLPFTLIGAAFSGAGWTAAAVVGLFAYFSENTPSHSMARFSVAYHQVLGLAAFIGPLIGSGLANQGIPIAQVLILGAVLRLAAAPILEAENIHAWLKRGLLEWTHARQHTRLASRAAKG